jgi:hypothetical protein
MPRKTRKRAIHYVTFIFADGAAVACTPTRRPSKKRIRDEGIHIDADHVVREYKYSSKEFDLASDRQRIRMADLLSNRLNGRRTIRELVLPVLANIETALGSLSERLERIERTLAP